MHGIKNRKGKSYDRIGIYCCNIEKKALYLNNVMSC